MNAMKTPTKISACALFCILGFLGNWFKLELFFNVDFLFGSLFTMLAILVLGAAGGVVVGTVAGTCTYLLWNHPWAIIILAAEALSVACAYSKRKGNPVIYDMLYWVCLGMPLVYLFYHHVMGMQLQSTLVVMLKQSVNGLFNTLMASLALILVQFMRKAPESRMPYSQVLFVLMVTLVLLPSTILMVSGVRIYQAKQTQSLQARVSSASEAARKILADWIQEHHRNVLILSTLVGDPNSSTYEVMQHYVEIIKAATPAFRGMGVFQKDSITVSYSPLEEDGKPTLGVDFSERPHVAILRREKKPYITDVLMSKLGNPSPIVIFLAPITLSGEYRGYCSGVVETSLISGLLKNLAGHDVQFTVVDGLKRVIVSTVPGLKTMNPFPRPYGDIRAAEDSLPILWKPNPKPNTSPMQQWRSSFFFRLERLLDSCSWEVIVEASCNPLIEDISQYSLSRLGLLGLLILLTVALSHFLSNGFISSIAKLQALTRSLPERLGDAVSIDWPESRIEELAELSHNFREMAVALLKDITHRKHIEDELRYKNVLLATQQEVSVEGILVVDVNDRIVSYNRRFVEIWGIPPELMTSEEDRPVLEFVANQVADPQAFVQKVRYLYEHRDEISQDEVPLADGRVLERYSAPMCSTDRSPYLGRVWYFRDVTERKLAEAVMRERLELQDQIAKVAATVPGMICSFQLRPDGSTCMPFATDMIKELYGLNPEDVREDFSPIAARIHPDDVEALQKSVAESSRTMGPWHATFRIRHPKKGELWVEGRSLPRSNPDGSIVWHGFIMDITERKRAEEALRESERRYRMVADYTYDWEYWIQPDGEIVYVSPSCERITGYPAEEFIRDPGLFKAVAHPDDQEWVTAHMSDASRPDGEVCQRDYRILTRSGEIRWLSHHCQGVRADDGTYLGRRASNRDISDRMKVQEDKEKVEGQLRQAQKMEAIGTLAGGIAHDFNNILSPIIGYTELALDEIPESNPSRFSLHEVLSAAGRAKELVKQILSFSRMGEEKLMTSVDVSRVATEALRLLRASLPSSIEIRQDIEKVTILADSTQIHQVLVNLCTNAAHAMEEKGILDVSLSELVLSEQDLRILSLMTLQAGKYLRLTVSDTGNGMDAATMSRIFDPYFTTKEVGKGTGLGLAVVHGIVKRHGGDIRVQSELGKGSVFQVYIPISEEELKPVADTSHKLPGGHERILFVDDEPMIVQMGATMLGRLGYKVTSVTSPLEAVDLFRSAPTEFDLVITDYTMPQMTGTELSGELMNIRHDVPVILCTGYSERVTESVARELGIMGFAMKPIDRRQLATLVRDVLSAAKG